MSKHCIDRTQKKIRSQYRTLISEVQENAEDMMKADNNDLSQTVEKASELFKDGWLLSYAKTF